jgi:hypothetical protein
MVSEELMILRICTPIHTHTQTLANLVKAWLLLSEEGASPDTHLMQGPEKYGIARIYALDKVMAGELVEFEDGTIGFGWLCF